MNEVVTVSENIIMLAIVVVAVVFLIGLAIGDWHGYRRRKAFDKEVRQSFELDDDELDELVENKDHMKMVYAMMGKGKGEK